MQNWRGAGGEKDKMLKIFDKYLNIFQLIFLLRVNFSRPILATPKIFGNIYDPREHVCITMLEWPYRSSFIPWAKRQFLS